MWALYKKEVRGFLHSLIGYVVIIVFLLMTGLFMWVFPGEMNTLDNGYAEMDTLFLIGPWVFLFLIPAITMRSFSEEKRTGTLEFLLTKPLTDTRLVLAKFLAGWTLSILSILPTLVYYLSLYQLAVPAGNLDNGGILGSYIGLVFLSGAFVSIGIFASSLTANQIVAFILAVFLCFFMFIGFESIASFDLLGSLDAFVIQVGMNEHYRSLSRGVIDTRDVAYFIGIIVIFAIATRTGISARKW